MTLNLPKQPTTDSSIEVREFFDKFYSKKVSFPVQHIDAIVAFFMKRDFDSESAKSIAMVILNQAREDNINVLTVMDKLKGLTDVQLNYIIAQILNSSREKTSIIGYRIESTYDEYETRNILV